MKISIKRIYEKPSRKDGIRILVDRLWPRGVSKSAASVEVWMKDLAPSEQLRKYLHVDKEGHYERFSLEYKKELENKREEIRKELKNFGKKVTIVTAVKDMEKSHIPALVAFLESL
ncbi:MAG TPA: DUF488 family protein [Candidatus Moranbacteria bacterium]|nr:DUF488 family protein [Candidatus Moranbacteria bacterium]